MKPVVLLIPGMLNTAAIWDRVVPLLQDAAELRIADVLTQTSIAEMARDAWALLADLAPATPLVICGFSMGGYVAIEMVARPARAISGLVLLDTSPRPESPEGEVTRAKTIAAFERNFVKVVENMLPFSTHPDHHQDAELFATLRAIMSPVGGDAAVRQTRAVAGRADHRVPLAALTIPTRVLCGREDKVTPPVLSEELAALIPGAKLEWLARSGHMTPIEQPGEVASAIRHFL
ncbi:MAG: alpha/beta fold hydrolase [Burkholderiaceae bacterium]